jgi:lipopolysaccharide transport protein LptA
MAVWASGLAVLAVRADPLDLLGDIQPGTNATVITARRLEFDYPKRVAVFERDVVVTDPAVRITADSLTVAFATNNQPETLTAAGNVRIEQMDRTGVCARAVYSVSSGLLVLTGKPRFVRGSDVLKGSRIIFRRDEERVTCEDADLTIVPGTNGIAPYLEKP